MTPQLHHTATEGGFWVTLRVPCVSRLCRDRNNPPVEFPLHMFSKRAL